MGKLLFSLILLGVVSIIVYSFLASPPRQFGGSGGHLCDVDCPCVQNSDCKEGEYCAHDIGSCGNDVESRFNGQCKSKKTECGNKEEPVCGCDGKSYKNPCNAGLRGVSVKSYGVCKI